MAKFSGGTYKDGVLSYVYEAKPGGRKNNINIKNIDGEWFFVDKKGKVRDTLANKGKLSKTHIDNLKGAPGSSEENIFASADVSPETGKGSTSVDAGGGIDTNAQNTLSGPIQRNTLGESNVSLPQTELPVSDAQRNFNPATSDAPIQTRKIANNAPGVYSAPTQTWEGAAIGPEGQNFGQSWSPGSGSNFSGSSAGSGPGAYAPLTLAPSATTDPNLFTSPKQSSYGGSEWQDKNPRGYGEFNPDGPGYRYTKEGAVVPLRPEQTYTPQADWSPGASSMTVTPTAAPNSAVTGISGPPGSDNSNMTSNYSSGWSPGVSHSGMPSEPGIPDTKDSPWGAADWSAVGSVMKGVGGLASAYTGIKNYQLARDAFSAQKNQWQADYNQRLKAYEDNKALANQDIEARNRTLQARGQAANQYSKLA